MRFSGLILLCVLSTAVQANELMIQRQPTVVYASQSTISAWHYFKRLQGAPTADQPVDVPEGAGIKPMVEQLPLTPDRLRVGKPAMRVQEGQVIPLFIMGMDPVSLSWFERAAEGLAEIGTRGVVVQASDAGAWRALQQHAKARGIDLQLLAGESLAEGYRIETYPLVIVGPARAGEGAYE